MIRGSSIAASLCGLLLLVAPGCREARSEPFRIAAGRRVAVDVTFAEEIAGTASRRSLRLVLSGTTADRDGMTSVPCTISGAVHEIRSERDAKSQLADTFDPAPSPTDGSIPDPPMRRTLERLRGAAVRLTFDAANGLQECTGIDAAIAATRDPSDPDSETSCDALRGLVSDETALAALSLAGLGAPPSSFEPGAVTRAPLVYVLGAGLLPARIECNAGRDSDGSVVVRGEGALRSGAEPIGAQGLVPPVPVSRSAVRVRAESQHDRRTLFPFRGHCSVELPFTIMPGAPPPPVLNVRTSFTFTLL